MKATTSTRTETQHHKKNGKPAARKQSSNEYKAMLENIPVSVIMADRDLVITYVNPASLKKLKEVEKYLPVRAEQVLGSKIDIFHKNPSFQQKLLADPKNLPHRANIPIGPETADLLVTAIYDEDGDYIGAMVVWEIITEKLKTENDMARILSMMENAPVNVIFADRDLTVRYMNPPWRPRDPHLR